MEGLLTSRDLSGEDDYYELLGCDENSTAEQIATEFKQLARRHHPDKEQDQELKDKAEKYFMRLEAAKGVLLDKDQRDKYDQWRSGGFKHVVSFNDWLAMQSRVHSSIHWAKPHKKTPSLPEPETTPSSVPSATTSDHTPQDRNLNPEPTKRAKVESPQEAEKQSPLKQFRRGSDTSSQISQFRNYHF